MTRERARLRKGLTLLELVVALTISAIVLLGAREVVDGVTSRTLVESAADRDHLDRVNGERLLHELVLDARASVEPNGLFGGDGASATWDTWCRVPSGWKERCRVSLETIRAAHGDGYEIHLSLGADSPLTLMPSETAPRLAYLDDARFGGTWVSTWGPSTARPVALGIVTAQDTLILPTSRAAR